MGGGQRGAAYLLTMLEEAPPAVLGLRPPRGSAQLQVFSPLVNLEWAAIMMGYRK